MEIVGLVRSIPQQKPEKEKKSILLENTFLPFGVEMLFSWFIIAFSYIIFSKANIAVDIMLLLQRAGGNAPFF